MSSATIDFPNGERHRVVADEPDRLVIEFAKPPGEGANLSHTHEHSDEVFDVLAGRLRFTLGWTVRELGAGDRIRIPRRSSTRGRCSRARRSARVSSSRRAADSTSSCATTRVAASKANRWLRQHTDNG